MHKAWCTFHWLFHSLRQWTHHTFASLQKELGMESVGKMDLPTVVAGGNDNDNGALER